MKVLKKIVDSRKAGVLKEVNADAIGKTGNVPDKQSMRAKAYFAALSESQRAKGATIVDLAGVEESGAVWGADIMVTADKNLQTARKKKETRYANIVKQGIIQTAVPFILSPTGKMEETAAKFMQVVCGRRTMASNNRLVPNPKYATTERFWMRAVSLTAAKATAASCLLWRLACLPQISLHNGDFRKHVESRYVTPFIGKLIEQTYASPSSSSSSSPSASSPSFTPLAPLDLEQANFYHMQMAQQIQQRDNATFKPSSFLAPLTNDSTSPSAAASLQMQAMEDAVAQVFTPPSDKETVLYSDHFGKPVYFCGSKAEMKQSFAAKML